MWIFEPHVAEQVFEDYVKEFAIPVHRDEWLDRAKGVKKDGARITSITTLSGKTYAGKMFIDATYEGDLMAAAGVSYHVGREANARLRREVERRAGRRAAPPASLRRGEGEDQSVRRAGRPEERRAAAHQHRAAGRIRRAATSACRPTASACA